MVLRTRHTISSGKLPLVPPNLLSTTDNIRCFFFNFIEHSMLSIGDVGALMGFSYCFYYNL